MFRVVENSDGTTTVYCKESGNVVCVVNPNSKSRSLCIGQARPRILSPTVPVVRTNGLPPVRDANFAATSSGIDLERRSPTPPRYPSLDYSDDCITQEQFLQTLNLVSREKFKKTPTEQLKEEFPYRHISKVEPKPFCAPPEAKLHEGLPICCLLTEKWLKLEPVASKFVRNSEQNLVNWNKAATYCKTSLPQSEDSTNVPKLRCREMKLYPLTYRVNKTWKYVDHMYCFNKKERMERYEILRTGLSRKGKILLKRCRPCSVVATKMTKAEIESEIEKGIREAEIEKRIRKNKVPSQTVDVQAFYMRKSVGRPFKTPLSKHPGLVSYINNPDKYIHLKNKFDGIINHTAVVHVGSKEKRQLGARYSSMKLKKKDLFRCKVLLSNVLWDLSKQVDACYVEETSIKVNDIDLLPLFLWQRSSRALNVKTYDNRHSTASQRNGPYHPSLTTQKRLVQAPQPNLFANKNPRVSPPSSHEAFQHPVLFSRLNRTLKTTFVNRKITNVQKPTITCIDLTNDDDDDCNSDANSPNAIRFNGNFSKSNISEGSFTNGTVKVEKSKEINGTWGDLKENGVISDSRHLKSATNTYSSGAAVNGTVKNGCWPGILLEKAHAKRKLSGSSANEDYSLSNLRGKINNGRMSNGTLSVHISPIAVPKMNNGTLSVNSIAVPKMNNGTLSVNSIAVPTKTSPYSFHCHGCKHIMNFFDESDAYSKVRAHMAQFHSVAQPDTFLGVKQTSDTTWLIEGFPGFKG